MAVVGVRVATTTAIVVDRWPLVRLGLMGVLANRGVDVVGQAAKVSEGLLLARLRSVDLLVFGSAVDGLSPRTIRSAKQADKRPKIVVLVPPAATAAEIGALFAAGADALLVASVGPDELAEALSRVDTGERVVGANLGPDGPGRPPRPGAVIDGDPDGSPSGDGAGFLTVKELEVLALLAQGHSNKQIARALYVSDATVKTHLQHIYGKLEVQSRFGALSRATELGLLR